MKNYKTTHNLYSAWNYEREIEDLNNMSEQGWQLVAGRMFSCKFKRDESVCYRYQLDYRPKLEDKPGYIESFREFGWQYVCSTLNGWHYFRKPYDSALPEEEYEIFSDRSSLQEMNNRWRTLGIGLLTFGSIVAALLVVHLIMRPTLSYLAMFLEYALLLFFLGRGVYIMKNPDRSKNRKSDVVLTRVIFTLVLLCAVGALALLSYRANTQSNMSAGYMDALPADPEEACLWNTIKVSYPDLYYIDLDIKADAPLTFTMLDEAGETVYTATGADVSEEDIRVLLHRGEYRIYLSDFAGGAMEVNFDM